MKTDEPAGSHCSTGGNVSWLDHSIAARLKIGPIGVVVGRTIPGIDHDEHQLAGAGEIDRHTARAAVPPVMMPLL